MALEENQIRDQITAHESELRQLIASSKSRQAALQQHIRHEQQALMEMEMSGRELKGAIGALKAIMEPAT